MQWVWGPFAWDSTAESWNLPDGCFCALDYRRLSDQGPQSLGQRNFALFAARDSATFGLDHVVLGSGNPREINIGLTRRLRLQSDLVLPTTPQAGNLAELALELLLLYPDPDGADMAMPLVPTTKRRWRIAMAGHALQLNFSQGHAAYGRLRDLLRRTYKRLYNAVASGELPQSQHRKWLGAQCLKYFGRFDDSRYTEFFDGTVEEEMPLRPTTTVSDNFNDGNLTGWTQVSGTWTNPGTVLQCDAAGNIRFDTDLSTDDHYAEFSIVSYVSFTGLGPMVRKDSTATNTSYNIRIFTIGDNQQLYKVVSGTSTNLANNAAAVATGSVLRLQVNGSNLEVFDDGVSTITATDTAITGNLRCGSWVSSGAGQQSDNFLAEDFVAAGAFLRHPGMTGGMRELTGGFAA